MIHPDRIFIRVCHAFCVEPEAVWSLSRIRSLSQPRMVAAYLMRNLTHMTMEDVTLYLNRTNHSTCSYWFKTIEEQMQVKAHRTFINKIKKEIISDVKSSLPAPDLQGLHPVLREGSRHTCRGHRLQWILQHLPEQEFSVSRPSDGEGRGDTETHEST